MSEKANPSRTELKTILKNLPDKFLLSGLSVSEPVSPEALEQLIDSDAEFFRDGDQVCRREAVFRGREFLITPEEWEIETGVLIPGHRFVPYVDPDVFPSDVVLRRGRASAPKREESFRLSRVIGCFPLLGTEQMLDILAAESPANGFLRSGVRGDSEVVLTVFDLSSFYREHDFELGDALKCQLVDYFSGIVKFGFVSGAKRSAARKRNFISALDSACEEVLRRFGDYLDVPEVLAWSFFLGGDGLNKPEASLDEFIRESTRIILASGADGRGELRPASLPDCETPEDMSIPEGLTISSGETGSLAAMLKATGAAVTPDEIDGFILDACATREMDFATFFSRAFRHGNLNFADSAQEAVFMNALEDRFEELTAHYNRVDDEIKAPLRSSLMELVEDRLDFLAEAATVGGTHTMDPERMRPLALVAGKLGLLLRMLNREAFMPDDAEAERLAAQLEEYLDEQETALEALRKDFSAE